MVRKKNQDDLAAANFQAGYLLVFGNAMLSPLLRAARVIRADGNPYPHSGLAIVSKDGTIFCNPRILAGGGVWARAIAHCLMHLAMGHFDSARTDKAYINECDREAESFLTVIKIGDPYPYKGNGTAGTWQSDMDFNEYEHPRHKAPDWGALFGEGLGKAIRGAVNVLAYQSGTEAQRVMRWFVSNYPLLGALASGFQMIEDYQICRRMNISVAAISCQCKEIYVNQTAGLSKNELKFVIAHELLHAALRHDARQQWRNAFLWNVACDFVINGWLVEMQIGTSPDGILLDKEFSGLSAESVYDSIAGEILNNKKAMRRLITFAGAGLPDILPVDDPSFWGSGEGISLDDFFRRALSQGLEYHQQQDRGYLPAGLIEEIRALGYPPIPWDVELARWFDEQFEPLEKTRSYARLSRRQSSTPDIPRPTCVIRDEQRDGRTFGVVLDTSGSMERNLLATALGAIASYSAQRDVPAARVVFCDAEAYDQDYMRPEDIAGVVKVKGRGGTELQPGIDLLCRSEDFPKTAPILIITDGLCEDRLHLYGREHAFLLPEKNALPFPPKGKVFRIRK